MQEIYLITYLNTKSCFDIFKEWLELKTFEKIAENYECYNQLGKSRILNNSEIRKEIIERNVIQVVFNYEDERLLVEFKVIDQWIGIKLNLDSFTEGKEENIMGKLLTLYNLKTEIINVIFDKDGNIKIDVVEGGNPYYPKYVLDHLI